MSEIILSNGMVALVEEQDFLFFNQWQYHAQKVQNTNYAMRYVNSIGGRIYFLLHREIIEHQGIIVGNLLIDHKDKNGLNNLHNNLRVATKSQNMSNRGPTVSNTSGYKGVSKLKRKGKWNGKWKAYIKYNYETINLGSFDLAISAAIAYNHAAKQFFGEFAWLNEIEE